MKKIFFLTSTLNVGGAEKMLYEMVRHLDRTRFQLKLCCLYGPGPIGEALLYEGIDLSHSLMRNRYDLVGVYRFFRLLKGEAVDCLYMGGSPLTLFWGFICSRILNVPRIVTVVHATMKLDKQVGFKSGIVNRLILHRLDRIGVVSNAKLNALAKEYKLNPKKLALINNGIDIARFTNLRDRNGIRQKIGISKGDRVIGMVGRLVSKKGHDIFLKSAQEIIASFPKSKFLIIGDGEERPALESMAAILGIKAHVIFLGQRDDIPDLISLFDIAVLSSRDESLPVALLEYMAASRPIVATNVGGNSEIILNGESGQIVPPEDPEILASAVIELLTDRKKAEGFGRLARKRVEDNFSLQRMIDRMEEFLAGDSHQVEIMMVGPALEVRGGVSSFAKYYLASDLSNRFEIIYHPTTVDGNKTLKALFFIKSLIHFLIRLIVYRKIKIVHICSSSKGSFYRKAIILLLSRLFAKKVVFHIHGAGFDLFYNNGLGLRRFFIKKILDISDTIIVLSRAWYAAVRKMTKNTNIKIIPNPIDTSDFKSIGIKRGPSNLNVLTLGRLGQRKGTYDILNIVPDVLKEIPGARFYLAGDGDVKKIAGLCQEKGLEDSITILEWLDRTRLLEELKNASLFLLPSYHEGLPVAILEAMASGLPVISTRVGGIPELIEEGVNGFLVNPGQKQELTRKIIYLLRDRRLRERMARNNIEKIDSMFRSDRVINRFHREYEDLIQRG